MTTLTDSPTPFHQIGAITACESGELDDEATIELFQHLFDNGPAWSLQGHYGRTAMAFIDAGQCHWKGEPVSEMSGKSD